MNVIHETVLGNGLTVRFLDRSHRYFGDYHNVRLDVICDIPVPQNGDSVGNGASVSYRSTIGRMAVPTADIAAVIGQLLEDFTKTTLAYMASPSFPSRYLRSQLSASRRRNVTYIPGL